MDKGFRGFHEHILGSGSDYQILVGNSAEYVTWRMYRLTNHELLRLWLSGTDVLLLCIARCCWMTIAAKSLLVWRTLQAWFALPLPRWVMPRFVPHALLHGSVNVRGLITMSSSGSPRWDENFVSSTRSWKYDDGPCVNLFPRRYPRKQKCSVYERIMNFNQQVSCQLPLGVCYMW